MRRRIKEAHADSDSIQRAWSSKLRKNDVATKSMPVQLEWLPERIQSGETTKEIILRPELPEYRA